jgi:threonyl-tRNA synthetase
MSAGAEKQDKFVRFVVVDGMGQAFEVSPQSFDDCPALRGSEPSLGLLRQFIRNEIGEVARDERPPKHVEYMRKHQLLDYCDVSEKGHFKWYPKGVLMFRLLLDYAARLSADWGAFEMRNPMVIRGDNNLVGQLMEEFLERDYKVDGGRGICYLRYASDPLAFPFMQNLRFGRKQCPLRVYEEANCFRNEQQGAVSGLKRVRHFMMTDMHAACASGEQARGEFERLCLRFGRLMNDIVAAGRWVLGWEGTIDFYEANREWLIGIGKSMGTPAFFKLMPQMTHYYAIKNEYQVITEDRSNIQVSTVQWDVKDGERFDIGFVDEDGRKHPCPVIIHASSFGSIERTLCAILESIAVDESEGRVPMFPLWLAPTQVRLAPVSGEYVSHALQVCERLAAGSVRVDVDDSDDTVGKKVRNAEKEWVPYIAVIGRKEQESGLLAVRCRKDGSQSVRSEADLAESIRAEVGAMPYRPLPLPRMVSERPLFWG